MSKTIISTDKAPAAIGPYSQAILMDGWLFTAGQIPLDPGTGEISGSSIEEQTTRVLENLKGVLAGAGIGFGEVVKTTVFLTDLGNFAAMNGIYASYFGDSVPARSTVQVAALPKGSLIEIEAVAHCR